MTMTNGLFVELLLTFNKASCMDIYVNMDNMDIHIEKKIAWLTMYLYIVTSAKGDISFLP